MSTTADRLAARRGTRELQLEALADRRVTRATKYVPRRGPGSYRRSDRRAAIREDA